MLVVPTSGAKSDQVQGLLVRLGGMTHVFSQAEGKVAAQVLKKPHEIVYCSVTEVAELAGVSEATVLRFARRLGYRSYQDLKMDLARDVFSATPDGESDQKDDSLISQVSQLHAQAIQDTTRLIDPKQLEAAINALTQARSIHFFGVGHSWITAKDASYRLFRLGFRASAFDDPHFQLMAAATLREGDVAVGLSVSGSTKDTVDSLAEANARGAKTIAVTAYVQAPITRYADIVLLTSTREAPTDSGAFTSKVAQLFILDLLCTSLVRLQPGSARETQEQIGKAISPKLY